MDAEHREAIQFLEDRLGSLGRIEPFGSACRSKAFLRGHDFDIGLYTGIPSKVYLESRIKEVTLEWPYKIPLHVFVIGDFHTEMLEDKNYIIHFTGRISGKILWLSILWRKFLVSMLKRYRNTKRA